ncbi:MAG: hypothetical protein IPI14_11375 [Polaromonas sp.]|nr:hypothetical protein [Polaromonas sp.]
MGTRRGRYTSDHLMPVFNNNRLFIYWLIIEEARDDEKYDSGKKESAQRLKDYKAEIQNQKDNIEVAQEEMVNALQGLEEYPDNQHLLDEVQESENQIKRSEAVIRGLQYKAKEEEKFACYFKIQLGWSVFENQKWAPTTLSEVKLNSEPSYVFGANPVSITATTNVVSSELQVKVRYYKEYTNIRNSDEEYLSFENPINKNLNLGVFYIGSCGDKVSLVSSLNTKQFVTPYFGNIDVSGANRSYLKWQLTTNYLKLVESSGCIRYQASRTKMKYCYCKRCKGSREAYYFPAIVMALQKGKPFIFEDAKTSYLVTKVYDAPGNPKLIFLLIWILIIGVVMTTSLLMQTSGILIN